MSLAAAVPAVAQTKTSAEEDPPPAAEGEGEQTDETDPLVLDPVEVFARKRSEVIFDVPISIGTRSGEEIENRAIKDTRSLVEELPNVSTISTGVARFTRFIIRGGGGIALDSPDDTSVGVYLDGLPLPKSLADSLLVDVEQVEVLRGPQGTLFGQNSQSGVINVRSRQPQTAFSAEAGGEWATEEQYEGTAVVNVPLVADKALARVAAKYRSTDGDIRDVNLERDVGDVRNSVIRATVNVFATDDLDFSLTGDHIRDENDHPSWIFRDDPGFPASAQQQNDKTTQESFGVGLTANYAIQGDLELTSVSSYRRIDTDLFTDNIDLILDAGAPFGSTSEWDEVFARLNQEVRLTNAAESGLVWLAGLNYGSTYYAGDIDSVTEFFGTFLQNNDVEIDGESYAVFGEVTFPLLDALSLTAGGRYTYEKKELDLIFRDETLDITRTQKDDEVWAQPTGRLALSYDWADDFRSFVVASRGWKPGGYNRFPTNIASGAEEAPFDESTSWAFELGTKARLAGGRVELGGSLFYTLTEDEQVGLFDLATNTLQVLNADIESYGFEAEGSAVLFEGFTLGLGVGMTEAEFTEDIESLGIREGRQVPNVPRWTGSIRATYVQPVQGFGADMEWVTSGAWTFTDSREALAGGKLTMASYSLLSLSTGLSWGFGEVYAFGRNLLDEDYETSAIVAGDGRVGVVPGEGRILGVGVKLIF